MDNIVVYTVCAMSATLLILISYTIRRKLLLPKSELIDIFGIFDLTSFSCLIIPFIYCFDGIKSIKHLLIFLNMFQYIAFSTIAYLWFLFVLKHMIKKLDRKNKFFMSIPFYISLIMCVVNLFVPFIFEVNDSGFYSRKFGYYIMADIDIIYILGSTIVYFIARKKNTGQMFLPVHVILLPIIISVVIVSFHPEIPILIATIAIGITAVVSSLQNETIYLDSLTGIYNRTYIDRLVKKIRHKKVIGIMIDVNDFKSINDNYGHKEGDKVLIAFANALRQATNVNGTCLRYAGDEFLVFLNTCDFNKVDEFTCLLDIEIDKKLSSINKNYKLTYSYGYSLFDSSEINFDSFMNIIDGKMYGNKKSYHNK